MRRYFLLIAITGTAFGYQPGGSCDSLGIGIKSLNLLPTEVSATQSTGFWGQAFRLEATGAAGFSLFVWRIAGRAILDFDERVSSLSYQGQGWHVGHLTGPISSMIVDRVYLVPMGNNSTENRTIVMRARPTGSQEWCQREVTVRMMPYRWPARLYTADHRDDRELSFQKGRVIDEHYPWHFFHHFEVAHLNSHPSFLQWHHLYIDRYQQWRSYFGYGAILPWRPRIDPFSPVEDLFLTGGQYSVQDSFPRWQGPFTGSTFADFENAVVAHHDLVHVHFQRCPGLPFGCFSGLSSPKSELFWRFHLALDHEYRRYCRGGQPGCPNTGLK